MKKFICLAFLALVLLLFSCSPDDTTSINLDDYDFFVDSSSTEICESQEETSSNEAEFSYILNTNTKKFHLPDCSWVGLMGEKNKSYRFETKEELIKKGYSPCYHCCLNN